MKWNIIGAVAVAVAVLVGTWGAAQTQKPAPAATEDPRIGKILEQNEKVLQNQEAILKALADIHLDLVILKHRTS